MSGDLINRSAVLDAVRATGVASAQEKLRIIAAVRSIPAVEAEPVVHAHWVSEIVKKCDWKGQKRDYYQPYSCPVCHTPDLRKGGSRYCSECGAKMDKEIEDV